ncbi:GerMN domain-containing protein [Patescibacteria group bacterium]|nr:GerMN domain-containing protein [Patescibacteria group bacterium]
MKKIISYILVITSILVLQGCNNIVQPEIEPAEVEVEELVVEDIEEIVEDDSEKTASVTIFLVELYNPDKEFTRESVKDTGCDDHLVPFEVKIEPTKAMLRTTLEQLFSIKNDVPDGLYNALSLSDINIEGIGIENSTAIVNLSGPYAMAGSCSGPRFVDQIKETVLQFSNIKNAEIFLDGRDIESFSSLK